LNSAWRRIIHKKERKKDYKEDCRDILLHAGQLAQEMNLRLLLWQELYGDCLFVEEIAVTGLCLETGKERRLLERALGWIRSRRRKDPNTH